MFPTDILRYDAVMLTEILSYTLSPAIQWDIILSHTVRDETCILMWVQRGYSNV